MIKCFGDLIKGVVEAYVDDIKVKTRHSKGLASDLGMVFDMLKANDIKLNPVKCVFSILGGMALGFLVFDLGIEANPKKTPPLRTWGRLATSRGYSGSWGF